MAVLNIRNLPEEVHRHLRIRAAKAGRSMEAEARAILAAACLDQTAKKPASALQDLVEEMFGADKPSGVVDDLIEERRREAMRE